MAIFNLNACNCLTWSVCAYFYLQILLGGYLSLRCRNLCYNEFRLGVFCVGIGGVCLYGLVDSLSFVGERVDHDSPAKLCKFNIVSMGSRTNLGDFVL